MVTDILDKPLALAPSLGADHTVNVGRSGRMRWPAMSPTRAIRRRLRGRRPVATIARALRATQPRSTIVLVGQGAVPELPISTIVGKELVLRGSFRFAGAFSRRQAHWFGPDRRGAAAQRDHAGH
ncbi:hypothetical protein [Mesorhizobium sp.]|uniref:hypothetical protein n=1 Tax=Mesorhizobium sp. TaxID=1871066 RepID=UPI003416295E